MFSNNKGFTLVELAIVMTIIGLLIGGILKGQELLQNARITSTIAQLQSFEAALTSFRDAYDAMPGDIAGLGRVPNCTVANACMNGNGDGVVGTPDVPWLGGDRAINTEETQVWKHLALAGLIGSVNGAASTLDWGQSNPASKLGGGFDAFTVATGSTDSEAVGMGGKLIFRLHGIFDNDMDAAGNYAVSAFTAGTIDRKMDDGKVFTGRVRAGDGWNDVPPCEADRDGVVGNYDLLSTEKACKFYYVPGA